MGTLFAIFVYFILLGTNAHINVLSLQNQQKRQGLPSNTNTSQPDPLATNQQHVVVTGADHMKYDAQSPLADTAINTEPHESQPAVRILQDTSDGKQNSGSAVSPGDSKKSGFDAKADVSSRRKDTSSNQRELDEVEEDREEPATRAQKHVRANNSREDNYLKPRPQKPPFKSFLLSLQAFMSTLFKYYPEQAWENLKRMYWFVIRWLRNHADSILES